MPIQRFDPKNQGPARGFIPAIKTGNTVYVSGQTGRKPDGAIPSDITGQATQTFENLKSALALAGATLDQIVKITVYVTHKEDMDPFRAVRAKYMKNPNYPTSTLVVVTALAQPELRVEVEAWAYTG
jgi:enamine deaminase RidA (YjgF/YER057c/UK114 family)